MAWRQTQQQRVEPVPDAGCFVGELVAGADEKLQVGVEMSGVHPRQIRLTQRNPSDHYRVAVAHSQVHVTAAVDPQGRVLDEHATTAGTQELDEFLAWVQTFQPRS